MLGQLNINGDVLSAIEVNNKLYLGGSFTSVLGQPRRSFAVINLEDGSLHPFNPSFFGSIRSMCDIGGGRILIAGIFPTIQYIPSLGLFPFTNQNIVVIDSASIDTPGEPFQYAPFKFLNIDVPVYPGPSNIWALNFSYAKLFPIFGKVKYNPTTNTAYASITKGGVSIPGGLQDLFGVIAINATTLEVVAGLGQGFKSILYTTSALNIPGYPYNTPTPLLVSGDAVDGVDIDVSGQNIYVSKLKTQFENTPYPPTYDITRYDISDPAFFTENSWSVTSNQPAGSLFFRNSKVFLFSRPFPDYPQPFSNVQGTSVGRGAVVASTPNPTSGDVSPFNIGQTGPTGASLGVVDFLATVYDVEEYDGKLFFWGAFGALNGVPGECVLSLDATTYARQNSPINTTYWSRVSYNGPPQNTYVYGRARTYFRHEDKIHVFGFFPQVSGMTRPDARQLILDKDANLPQNKFLIAL